MGCNEVKGVLFQQLTIAKGSERAVVPAMDASDILINNPDNIVFLDAFPGSSIIDREMPVKQGGPAGGVAITPYLRATCSGCCRSRGLACHRRVFTALLITGIFLLFFFRLLARKSKEGH
jgi:hypothetical protein